MCFKSAAPPTPQAPPPPPAERDSNITATQDRQRAAARANQSGLPSTIATSPLGDTSSAPTYKATLGA